MRSTLLPVCARALAAAAGLALLLSGVPVGADTKVVTEVVVTGLPQAPGGAGAPGDRPAPPPPPAQAGEGAPPPPPNEGAPPPGDAPAMRRTVTTYYRADKARVEDGSTRVVIYDTKGGKLFRLDTAEKTYSETPLKRLFDVGRQADAGGPGEGAGPGGGAGPMRGRIELKAETKVEVKAKDETRSIAGAEARQHLLEGTMALRPDFGGMRPGGPPGGGRPGGGFPGGGRGPGGGFPGGGRGPGGGFPGGGRGPGGGPGEEGGRPGFPSTTVEGEFWLSQAVALSGVSAKNKLALLPTFVQTLPEHPMLGAFLKPLTEKMAKAKGFPMASRVSVTLPRLRRRRAEAGDAQPPAGDAASLAAPVVVTTEVRSITEDALDEALFAVPAEYRKVDPRARPAQMPAQPF